MGAFVLALTLLLASTCSASIHGALSSQYHTQDHIGQYSYGYSEPNSQKHEARLADGTTKGSYSYVDGHGHVQTVSYVADPHHGFQAAGTNLPKGPSPLYPVATAPLSYAHYAAPYGHFAHHPVALTAQGVPVDTPEVQHAKAAHFAAHAAAHSGHHLYKRSLWGGHAYAGYAHAPVIHNGVPVDTPEVQHAKAAHYAAHAQALGHAAHAAGPIDTPEVQHAKAAHFAAHAAARSGHPIAAASHHHASYHVPVIHNGVPVDTPEVQHAKAAHFAALARAGAGAGHHYAPTHHYSGPIHIPVIHNGVPVETPEVQHAKAAHYAAVSAARTHGGYGAYDAGHYDDGQYREHHQHGW